MNINMFKDISIFINEATLFLIFLIIAFAQNIPVFIKFFIAFIILLLYIFCFFLLGIRLKLGEFAK